MKEEITAGIKNALERGASLEDAARSFINAGYNPVEVNEAANNFSSGASNVLYSTPAQPISTTQANPLTQQAVMPQSTQPKPKSNFSMKKFAIIAILLLLLAGLVGAIIWVIYYGNKYF